MLRPILHTSVFSVYLVSTARLQSLIGLQTEMDERKKSLFQSSHPCYGSTDEEFD